MKTSSKLIALTLATAVATSVAIPASASPKTIRVKTIDFATASVSWGSVKGATKYQVKIKGGNSTYTTGTKATLTATGGDEIRVRAKVKAKWTSWSEWAIKPLTAGEKKTARADLAYYKERVGAYQGWMMDNEAELLPLQEQKRVADDYRDATRSASLKLQIDRLERDNSGYNKKVNAWFKIIAHLEASLEA